MVSLICGSLLSSLTASIWAQSQQSMTLAVISFTRDVLSYNWIPLVASSNPIGDALEVWPGMLFPNSRGIEAAPKLRLTATIQMIWSFQHPSWNCALGNSQRYQILLHASETRAILACPCVFSLMQRAKMCDAKSQIIYLGPLPTAHCQTSQKTVILALAKPCETWTAKTLQNHPLFFWNNAKQRWGAGTSERVAAFFGK